MTDQKKLTQLLDSFGVEYKLEEAGTTVSCKANDERVSGYDGYHVDFDFNVDGSFKQLGAWE